MSNVRGLRTLLLLLIAVVLPLLTVFGIPRIAGRGAPLEVERGGSTYPSSQLALRKVNLSETPQWPPRITNVQIVDLDVDGSPDILSCDALQDRVLWYRQQDDGQWDETVLAAKYDLAAPAHATVTDLDQDGDLDVVVSLLGSVWPTEARVGRVVWLENVGAEKFEAHVLLDEVRRVADTQAADLDGDGDQDFVVAVFGYASGRIVWMENREGRFHEHPLMSIPGVIHVPIHDYDGDGDLDVVAIASQEEEEVWGFENDGQAGFTPRRLMGSANFDLGSAGLVQTDLDQDGDADLLLSMGDNYEIIHHYPQPSHGCLWLENRGDWQFESHRIATLGGTYAADAGDFDADGDLDVALVSMFNDWNNPDAASLVWLENDGQQNFSTWQIASSPIHLATVACGDLNGDGRADIVAGGMHLLEPFDRMDSTSLWLSE